jgi:hypothetical protein
MRLLLGKLLSLAPRAYVEWPGPPALQAALQLVLRRNISASFDARSLLTAAANDAAGGEGVQVRLVLGAGSGGREWGGRLGERLRAAARIGFWGTSCETNLWAVCLCFSPAT